ncbi:MAG: glycerol acyltransferase, partial [Saprospiraceae bacterium]
EFSVLSFLNNLNTVFFPGGTRSRSGALEKNLKFGLLGTLIEAQNHNYEKGLKKKIMVVPLVVSYHFIFEAEDLINQHLRKEGRANYIASRTKKKTSFFHLLQRFLKSDSEVYMSFGKPMDVFGNELNEKGESVKNGKIIDIEQHFISGDIVTIDKQRNDVYTRVFAKKILESYKTENIVLSSHLVAFSAYKILESKYKDLDKFTLLSLAPEQVSIPLSEYEYVVTQLLDQLKKMNQNGSLKLSPIMEESTGDIISDGLKHLNSFHASMPWYKDGDMYKTMNLKLLYFYHNRLTGYQLEKVFSTEKKEVS